MSSINRYKIIKLLNSSVWNNDVKEVADLLNVLFESDDYKNYLDLVYSAISSFQLYGFLSYFTDEEREDFLDLDFLRSNSYKGSEIDYYNKGQLSLLFDLERNKKILFSAPTSFGKTSIIIEYIIQNSDSLKNIVFVVPTNSLLEELYIKLLSYNKSLNMGYNISNQPNKVVGKNIFLLTPERFLVFVQSVDLSSVDLMIMDEMYKISDGNNNLDFVNNRSLRFRKVSEMIAGTSNRVVFLSPFTYTISDSMKKFLDKYGIIKLNRKIEYVKRDIVRASEYIESGIRTNYQKVIRLLEYLADQQNIVYVQGYSKGYDIVNAFNSLNFDRENERYVAFYEHIIENYLIEGCNWAIAEAIKKGIGMYIGPMPRYIKKELVSLYEKGIIKTMIVTTAFTEGVNTNAKNLIITSIKNGSNTNELTDIDILNTIGRVGRFSKESVGKVFCLSDSIYEKVCKLQENSDCIIENNNYINEESKSDYEIEMVDEEYLSHNDISRKKKLKLHIEKLGLTTRDLQISLNVSNQWKIWLYEYIGKLDNNEINIRYEQLQILLKEKEGDFENAMSIIFKDIKQALEVEGIKAFPVRTYEIPAFDKKGEFVWARLYKYYASGNIKSTISNNIKYITGRFKQIVGEEKYMKKKQIKPLFAIEKCEWILSYYTERLEINYNKFYSECFRFISNVVQYKIPFYLSFYISIFKLYLKKGNFENYELSKMEEKDIMLLFEEGGLTKEYEELLEFGIPIITLEKIREAKVTMNELKEKYTEIDGLDKYEKMLLNDYYTIL